MSASASSGTPSTVATVVVVTGGDVDVVVVGPDSAYRLRRDLELRFFPTDHWVPTLGSILVWRRHHLLPELAGLSGEEIARRGLDLVVAVVLRALPDLGPVRSALIIAAVRRQAVDFVEAGDVAIIKSRKAAKRVSDAGKTASDLEAQI